VIVVGVDGSDASVAALEWGIAQARVTGATVKAVMTWHLPYSAYGVSGDMDLGESCREELARAISSAGGDDPGVTITPVVIAGAPAPTLIQLSEDADLLVVGSRGHGAFSGMVLGSVSQHCLGQAACPTVVVPDPKHDRAQH
jgi:nucleotide-binding universal stress UspA family protein